MALMVETKDCTALSDAEIEEMADLIEDEPVVFDVGELSKQRDAWVLVTQVRDCLLYTSPSPRDPKTSRMPSSA